MGRPREHDEHTRAALLQAAERLVTAGGPAALSVRAVAREAGTSTRAVYSLFGSKDGLVVDALAQDAFRFLYDHIAEIPETDDPVNDLVAIGHVFRRLVVEHPARYRIAFQRIVPGMKAGPELVAARERARSQLYRKVERLGRRLGKTSVEEAAMRFNAMLEGLANAELRGSTLPWFEPGDEDRAWRDALETVVRGFARAPRRR